MYILYRTRTLTHAPVVACRLSRGRLYCCAHVLQECGVALQDFNDFKEGDVVQCFTLDEVKAAL